jgi:hypothetical protein
MDFTLGLRRGPAARPLTPFGTWSPHQLMASATILGSAKRRCRTSLSPARRGEGQRTCYRIENKGGCVTLIAPLPSCRGEGDGRLRMAELIGFALRCMRREGQAPSGVRGRALGLKLSPFGRTGRSEDRRSVRAALTSYEPTTLSAGTPSLAIPCTRSRTRIPRQRGPRLPIPRSGSAMGARPRSPNRIAFAAP